MYMLCIHIRIHNMYVCVSLCVNVCVHVFVYVYNSTGSMHVHTEGYRHSIDAVVQSGDRVAFCDSVFISRDLMHTCMYTSL